MMLGAGMRSMMAVTGMQPKASTLGVSATCNVGPMLTARAKEGSRGFDMPLILFDKPCFPQGCSNIS
jgi:hypothetical protein